MFKIFLINLVIVFLILFSISFLTLYERKLLAGIQRRHGPCFTGFNGILQPFADGLKLILKETNFSQGNYITIFVLASILSLTLSLLN
jgi:NADH-quinone oxidoreductase subunit H